MGITIENETAFQKILETLHRREGFDARPYKANYIKRRVAVRMRATGSSTYHDYLKALSEAPEESSLLLEKLTIHVTSFFRDPGLHRALREKILPAAASDLGRKFRVWCAGCSTGQEPYSLSILLSEWGGTHPSFSFGIWATDIDGGSLRMAEKGEYPAESLREAEPDRLARWFSVEGPAAKVRPEVRSKVRFHLQDLLGDWGEGWWNFDMIFCRNLLIYLAAPQQQKLYPRFHRVLKPNGFLILGATETILGEGRGLYRCVDLKHRIYQAVKKG